MDSALGILSTGYSYFLEKFRHQKENILHDQLLFNKIIAMRGGEAAKIFYDRDKFTREGATPKRFQKTLFGQEGVQGLNGKAHKHRKAMLMKSMNPESIEELCQVFERRWMEALPEWERAEKVVLFDEVEKVIMRAVCEWTGVPLPEEDVEFRTRQISELIDSSGKVGLKHIQGRIARKKAEHWMMGLVSKVRKKQLLVPDDITLGYFSKFRDEEDRLLDKHVVAVEMLNIIRPTVAIARYIVFAALALHEYPEYKEKFRGSEGTDLYHYFIQEVRRYYPFFPFVVARVKRSFEWQGHIFPRGRRVLLDLYATNHDENYWEDADDFHPERFANWDESPFNFIPQGGGDHYSNHRCAGEWVTIKLSEVALKMMTEKMEYTIPDQDLHVSLSTIPAIPESRFVIEQVRAVTEQKVVSV